MELDLSARQKLLRSYSATAEAELEGESPLKLTDKAHTILEEMIVTLKLAPGSTWSEASICDRIEIGRTPVREALQRLALEQLVQIVPRYGVIVTEILVPEQIMVVEARRVLDPLIASRAARRSSPREKLRTGDHRRKLIDLLQMPDAENFLRLHLDLRRFVAACTRNKFLAASLAPVDGLSRRFFFVHQNSPAQIERAVRLHADILQAIATDDEREAAAAANRLLDHEEEFTRAAFDSQY
jgi:DNA-binding GntR family transcriptional regulator